MSVRDGPDRDRFGILVQRHESKASFVDWCQADATVHVGLQGCNSCFFKRLLNQHECLNKRSGWVGLDELGPRLLLARRSTSNLYRKVWLSYGQESERTQTTSMNKRPSRFPAIVTGLPCNCYQLSVSITVSPHGHPSSKVRPPGRSALLKRPDCHCHTPCLLGNVRLRT